MRNKTDARDAAAICVAMKRPDTLFVAVKSPEQQAMRGLERTRELLVKQRTQLANCLRSLFAEFGVIAAQGKRGFAELIKRLQQPEPGELPPAMQLGLRAMADQIEELDKAIAGLDAEITATAQQHPLMRLLSSIPSIGPITAHAIVAAIGDGEQFRSARSFAAWCGLTARVNSSGNKQRSGGISRQGDFRLRKLLALGASSLMRYARNGSERATQWQRGILARRPVKVAVIAQAAKTARIAWAILRSGETYRQADRPDVGLSRAAA
jgi:transposase